MNFDFAVPTRILFGSGRLADLGPEAKTFGDRAVVVFGKSAIHSGVLESVDRALARADVSYVHAPAIFPDPDAAQVDAIIAAAKQFSATLIIAVGGGSVMDAAKAAGAAAAGEEEVRHLVGLTLKPRPGAIPVIAVPTTAGTGSEVTRGAIIIDPERGLKSGIRGDDVQPRIAICDPDLLATMPHSVAADTIFDAFAHLVETAIVRRSTPISRSLSRTGLEHLLKILQDPLDLSNPAVRENLSLAALMGGINIAGVGSALPHRIQQALGSIPGVHCPHGRALSLVYGAWLPRAKEAAPEAFRSISEMLGAPDIERVSETLRRYLDLPDGLRSSGYGRDHVPAILKKVTGDVQNDPIRNIDESLIASIIEESL